MIGKLILIMTNHHYQEWPLITIISSDQPVFLIITRTKHHQPRFFIQSCTSENMLLLLTTNRIDIAIDNFDDLWIVIN